MFWSKGPDKTEPAKDKKPETPPSPAANTSSRSDVNEFDPDKVPTQRKLPKDLQKIVDKADKDENFFDDLVEG